MKLSKNIKLAAAASLVCGLVLIIAVNFTGAFRLQAVTVNGEPLENWRERYPVLVDAPVTAQPVDSLARLLLSKDEIHKVDIDYRLPGGLDIRTNEYAPVCYVVGEETGKLFGFNRNGRLISLERVEIDWERPVFTGLDTKKLHSFCDDPRVRIAITQLERLRESHADLYRLLEEIDFSEPYELTATVAGLPFVLLVRAESLVTDFSRFVDFVEKYETDLTDVYRLDLRYDNMIICARREK